MWRSTMNYGRKGLAVQAISAVDLALWDLCGKVRGEPVYQLLGGNTKPGRLPVYATTVRCVPCKTCLLACFVGEVPPPPPPPLFALCLRRTTLNHSETTRFFFDAFTSFVDLISQSDLASRAQRSRCRTRTSRALTACGRTSMQFDVRARASVLNFR